VLSRAGAGKARWYEIARRDRATHDFNKQPADDRPKARPLATTGRLPPARPPGGVVVELRDEAVRRLRRKRTFRRHLAAYVVVNVFLIVIWLATGAGYFWPGWVIAGWGIGVAANAWYVYGRGGDAITEADIARETERLRGRDESLAASEQDREERTGTEG
jgi:2TM domain